MNELKKIYIKDLEMENRILLIALTILCFIFIIWLAVAIKENDKLENENIKMQQQIIDYRWQLEQVEYIMQYKEEK